MIYRSPRLLDDAAAVIRWSPDRRDDGVDAARQQIHIQIHLPIRLTGDDSALHIFPSNDDPGQTAPRQNEGSKEEGVVLRAQGELLWTGVSTVSAGHAGNIPAAAVPLLLAY